MPAGPAVEADILVAALAPSAPGPHRLRLLVARDGGRSIQTAPRRRCRPCRK